MTPRPRHRRLVFALASSCLVLSAILFALGSGIETRPGESASRGAAARPDSEGSEELRAPAASSHHDDGEDLAGRIELAPAIAAERAALKLAARRFLAQFLAYEVGRISASVTRGLQRTATPEFARGLLGTPPRSVAGLGTARPARLTALEVASLPAGAGLAKASVTGTATRDGAIEPFSFRFERTLGGWLASGVGE